MVSFLRALKPNVEIAVALFDSNAFIPEMFSSKLSSLSLQICLYLNKYFRFYYLTMNIILMTYKGYKYNYPPSALVYEWLILFAIQILDFVRVAIADRGNKLEQRSLLICSICLSTSSLLGYVFFLYLQTYM